MFKGDLLEGVICELRFKGGVEIYQEKKRGKDIPEDRYGGK